MSKFLAPIGAALVLAGTISAAPASANSQDVTLAVTMTNDPASNAIQVLDARTHASLQTLSTQGEGGVAGNARGVKQYRGEIVAVVNNGSNTVAVFRRHQNGLKFEQLVATTSAPVSIDFGNDHMYVAGATTVDSFVLHDNRVGGLDGTTSLELVGGGVPPNGSTAQVGVVDEHELLVTLKTDPTPGTVDVVALDHGAVIGAAPTVVSPPAGTLTPFGFSVYPDGTALITLAHSSQDGLFRNRAFTSVIAAGQTAPCWMTRVGKYVFTANTGSQTISRLVGTGNNVFVDGLVAALIASGGAPSDIDADGGVLGVIDHTTGQSHLTLFTYDMFGELTTTGPFLALGVPNANGIAIVPPAKDRE
ncbi:MAG TPA: hypothetical protein VLV86_08625 [Vicinamibacterales bacterium]|nr:hypothetical protein [Vicinamibacterales bacterium]